MSFDFLGLAPETLRAINDAGYTEPTPIQAQAIPSVLMGKDIMGIAQTGTGKTASFTLPMIDILSEGRARARMPRSLILEPTRELAAQVSENFETYGKYHKLSMALLIGGVSFDDQLKKLDRGVDVLIATPGRLLDHFERGGLMLNGVDILVIDEADRMMDMGFIPDVERICSLMPQKHQTLFFSATMPKEIKRLADRFLTDPKQIQVASPSSTGENIEQFSCFIPSTDASVKRDKLREILGKEQVKNAIIFCNRKRDVDILFKSLKQHGFNAAALHGDMDQGSRTDVLAGFKNDEIKLLIASDVAARGLDIPAVSHVFNFDVPTHAEDYIHRIGRTGRAGLSGRAFTLVTKLDTKYLKNVQDLIGNEIPPMSNSKPVDTNAVADEDSKRGGRNRGRRGKSDNKTPENKHPENKVSDSKPSETKDAKNSQTAKTAAAESGAGEKAPAQNKDAEAKNSAQKNEPRQQNRSNRNDRSRDKNNSDRGNRRERGDRNDRNDRNRRHRDREPVNTVVGLGDHVPAFLMQNTEAKTEKPQAEKSKTAKTKAAKSTTAKPKKAKAEKPKTDKAKPKRTRAKSPKSEESKADEVMAEDVVAEGVKADVTKDEKPKPKRTRRKKVEKADVEAKADAKEEAAPTPETENKPEAAE